MVGTGGGRSNTKAYMMPEEEEEEEDVSKMSYMMPEEEEDGTMVFKLRRSAYSPVRAVVALALWLGAIHLNLLLLLASVFFFSRRDAALVVGTQLFLIFAPVNDTSRLGCNIARFVYKHALGYFPITLHVQDYAAFDPNKAYVFGYEPHCAMPLGLWVLAARVGFMPITKMKILASSAAFYVPFQRHIWTWLGLTPASKDNFYSYLGAGYSCAVVPGGLREMLHMDHEQDSEGHVYNWWRPGNKILVSMIRAIKAPPIIYWGKFGSPIPFRSPMHVYVGRPIEVKKINHPTTDEINEVHEKFIMALQELFNRHKNKAGYPNLQLKVI